jgi:four helix bundle protein
VSETIDSYRDLKIWQDAMSLAEACYRVTKNFPRDEMFGQTSQIRRASSSIAANIAEGHGRENTRPFIQHLRISQGSLKELETHLLLSQRVGLIPQAAVAPLLDTCQELGRMIRGLIRRLEAKKD